MKRIILCFFGLVFSLFFFTSSVVANEIENNIENIISEEKEQIKSEENKEIQTSNSSIKDIFGDEQTFPFVAGLGKNAAH